MSGAKWGLLFFVNTMHSLLRSTGKFRIETKDRRAVDVIIGARGSRLRCLHPDDAFAGCESPAYSSTC